MIISFKCKETEKIWDSFQSRKFSPSVQKKALEMLSWLDAITDTENIAYSEVPHSYHLKKLQGDRKTQWSIRVNDKYRLCFELADNNVCNVELVDYH